MIPAMLSKNIFCGCHNYSLAIIFFFVDSVVDVSNNYICCHTLFSTIYDFLLCSPLILQRARHFLKTELGGLV